MLEVVNGKLGVGERVAFPLTARSIASAGQEYGRVESFSPDGTRAYVREGGATRSGSRSRGCGCRRPRSATPSA